MLISVSESDPRPLYTQITGEIKGQIRQGLLSPGDELPSVRELADCLGINLHTVHKAYQVLRDQGVIHLRLGQRAKVAALRDEPASRDEVESALAAPLRELITEAFHLGLSEADFRRLVDELMKTEGQGR